MSCPCPDSSLPSTHTHTHVHIHTSWLSGKNFACVDHYERLSHMFITAYTFFSYSSSSSLFISPLLSYSSPSPVEEKIPHRMSWNKRLDVTRVQFGEKYSSIGRTEGGCSERERERERALRTRKVESCYNKFSLKP